VGRSILASEWRSKTKLPNFIVEGLIDGIDLIVGESIISFSAK
jgi:hypothetical protein